MPWKRPQAIPLAVGESLKISRSTFCHVYGALAAQSCHFVDAQRPVRQDCSFLPSSCGVHGPLRNDIAEQKRCLHRPCLPSSCNLLVQQTASFRSSGRATRHHGSSTESFFNLRGIDGDDSQYHLVVTALDWATTRRAMQLLRNPPQSGKYAALKNLLLWRFTLTDTERADRLLSLPGLGDGTAVDLMDSMLSLLGSEEGGLIFPHLFLRRLPPVARAAITGAWLKKLTGCLWLPSGLPCRAWKHPRCRRRRTRTQR
ncbi:uncharacterized protein LOC133538861 [Nerophis ophidion]|uniref:uncharacterized protein LOC133538861 n=1 Tax=Nerophis ophidion TaxID=159077 RepID=UPI002ADF6D9F|nr:uncharacterized protein LOC133538861 [Nerophis ophidion]